MDDNRGKKPVRKENPFREWLSDNLRYILLIIVIVAIVAAVIVGIRVISDQMNGGGNASTSQSSEESTPDSSGDSTNGEDPEVTVSATPAPEASDTPSPSPSPEAALTAAPDEVASVVTGYFQALAAQDADTLSAFVDQLSQEDRAAVENNQTIDAYNNIEVYVYPGEASGSYVAFAVYDYKYANFDTVLPGLTQLYLYQTEDGGLRIASDTDDSVSSYMTRILEREDVQTLIAETQAAYDATLEGHADLKEYVEGLS